MSQARSLRCRRFTLPKKGHTLAEYEDSFAADCAKGRFAVADGASESIFAGEWADLLCHHFVDDPPAADAVDLWRDALQPKWLAAVKKQDVPWYIEEKLRDGAFATFLGLVVSEPNGDRSRKFRALAIGDSCCFQLHQNHLKLAFPLESAGAFGVRPDLIGSRQRGPASVRRIEGSLAPGDRILLMTDALAQWFLDRHEAGRKPWEHLLPLHEEAFAEWIDARRSSHRLKNDDVTLLIIEPDELESTTGQDAPKSRREAQRPQ